jgi:hypothetical protein
MANCAGFLGRRPRATRGSDQPFFRTALDPLDVAVVSEGLPTYGVELCAKGRPSLCFCQTGEKPAPIHLAFTADYCQHVLVN